MQVLDRLEHRQEDLFAEQFRSVWANPSPAKLVALLHPEITLYHSEWEPIRGVPAAFCEFSRLFSWMPTLHGIIDRHCGSDGVLFIEWRMQVPVKDRFEEVRTVDRFLLRDGLAIERRVYMDERKLMRVIAGSPGHWGGYWKYRSGRKKCAKSNCCDHKLG